MKKNKIDIPISKKEFNKLANEIHNLNETEPLLDAGDIVEIIVRRKNKEFIVKFIIEPD